MRLFNYFILLAFAISSCKGQERPNPKESTKSKQSEGEVSEEFKIKIPGIDSFDFEITHSQDTVIYQNVYYEGLDGKKILFDDESVVRVNAKAKYFFTFLQYTVDDNPASPLKFKLETDWHTLKFSDDALEMPSRYNPSSAITIYEHLGFENESQLISWIESRAFTEIREESYTELESFYNYILKDNIYVNCCPQYIDEAKTFLKKDFEEFNSLKDLGIELVYDSRIIKISGQLVGGAPFEKVIIEKY